VLGKHRRSEIHEALDLSRSGVGSHIEVHAVLGAFRFVDLLEAE